MTLHMRWASSRFNRSPEGGYVAVMTALLLIVLMGISAFAVDVGNWYVVGQQEQRAADAAALAGVTSLPGDPTKAYATAQNFSTINGFQNAANATTVTPALDGGRPTRLRVTVSRTVNNIFGPLLGVDHTTVTRTAVADFAGPVPMGSPCNGFGNDPDAGVFRSSNCLSSTQMWANIGSHGEKKQSGDAFQDGYCVPTPIDNCSGPASQPNTDYDSNGYVYTVTVARAMTNLRIEVFDPAQVAVGDHCDLNLDNMGTLTYPDKVSVNNPGVRYVKGDDTAAKSAWCTGDRKTSGSGGGLMKTQFTVHSRGVNAWDPVNWPIQSCQPTQLNPRTFNGFDERLDRALDKTNATYFEPEIAESFRNWVDLCTIGTVEPGTYAIQVKTNGPGADAAGGGHNRFAIRASGSIDTDKDFISVAGFNKMAIFANFKGTTQFYLARVPGGAAGQTLNVRLFDVGDGSSNGTITILKPADAISTDATSKLKNCKATGLTPDLTALTKDLPDCKLTGVNSTTHQGRWQNVMVPIPSTYECDDDSPGGCWVKLQYDYGTASPADATSWTATIEGDPVRLVE